MSSIIMATCNDFADIKGEINKMQSAKNIRDTDSLFIMISV